jgi:DNA-binding NtrC family response regulator
LICNEHGIARKSFENTALSELQAIRWTGNIRELRNVVERLVILGENTITADDVKLFSNRH